MALTITEGTQTDVLSYLNAGTEIPAVKLDTGVGTAVLNWGGTIPTVANLTNGTVRISVGTITTGTLQNLVTGTINALAAGTITAGTVLTLGLRHADEFATAVSSVNTTMGTIRAAVAGSAIYVTSLVISVGVASNVVIGNGTNTNPMAGTFFFNSNGGIAAMPIDPPWRTSSGSALVYQQSATGSLTITATGYID